MDVKVCKEAAEAEFERFLEEMDIDADMKALNAEDLANFEKNKHLVIRAIMRGDMVVNEKGELIFTPRVPIPGVESFTFREPVGGSLKSTLGKKADDNARAMEVMGALTHQPASHFARMASRDYKVASAIVVLFLG